ncbi:13621_t:CDS:2, partial [Funneliformis mosseae]
ANIDKLDIIANMRLFDQPPIIIFWSKKELILSNNPSTQTNYSIYKNPMAGTEFLYAIAMVIEESILNEVHKLPSRSLLMNESNTIIHDKICAVSNEMAIYGENEIKILGDFYGNFKY